MEGVFAGSGSGLAGLASPRPAPCVPPPSAACTEGNNAIAKGKTPRMHGGSSQKRLPSPLFLPPCRTVVVPLASAFSKQW